jgi:RimJ/RimL family protein N-acetyltransferase
MQIETRALENRFVRLEPIASCHEAELRAACGEEPTIWRELYPYSMAGEHFDPAWTRMLRAGESGHGLVFAVMAGGRCRGMTSYLAIEPANRSLEIGGTYYAPELRGGAVNPAAKLLLLAHAFAAGASRVQFKVDALNARSRAAVLKLGAAQEGVLRQDRVTWTGRVRDTVVFSVLKDEWPAVRGRLDARLAAFD